MAKKKAPQQTAPTPIDLTEFIAEPFRGGAPGPDEKRIIVPHAWLTPDETNAMLHPDKNIRQIRASLRRRGQQTPINVDRNGKILKGNGTHEAAGLEDWEYIWIVVSGLEGAEAVGYAISDNASARSSKWDYEQLQSNVRLVKDEFDGSGLEFSDEDFALDKDELDTFLAAEFNPGTFTGEANNDSPAVTVVPPAPQPEGDSQVSAGGPPPDNSIVYEPPSHTDAPPSPLQRERSAHDPHPDLDEDDKAKPELSIACTANMRLVIDQAIERVRLISGDLTISEGKCVELISADYLAGAPNREQALEEFEILRGTKAPPSTDEPEWTEETEDAS
jgi:hypothetical protein